MRAAEIKIVQIIRADPGHYVLGALVDDNGYPVETCKYPVLALGFEKDSTLPYPITWEGAQTENVYILQPDGTVERPWIDGFLNVGDWLKAQQQEYTAKQGSKK
jgi:hypothetical protein